MTVERKQIVRSWLRPHTMQFLVRTLFQVLLKNRLNFPDYQLTVIVTVQFH